MVKERTLAPESARKPLPPTAPPARSRKASDERLLPELNRVIQKLQRLLQDDGWYPKEKVE